MKKNALIILFCCLTATAFAQPKGDSIAYQLEHAKINAMLAQRTQKFGQYDQSLTMHTGIFGLQTKKDVRRSNDILMDIVKTDDSIYREIKILFDYTVFQRTQVQDHSKEAIESNFGYMTTINKLRKQADLMKAEANAQQTRYEKTLGLLIVILVIMLLAIFYLVSRNRERRV